MNYLPALSALVTVATLTSWGCRKEEAYPPAQYAPYGTAPTVDPVSYPPHATGTGIPASNPPVATAQPTTAPPPNMAPAYGFPCVSDSDSQCPFGRCLQGRCGGCTDTSQCKPGAACSATPFGMACVWSGGPPTTVPSTPPTTPPPASGDAFATARASCVAKTNAYRARVGSAPVRPRRDQEKCGDRQAASDASTGRAHGAFGQCGERAQNECPGWPGPVETMLEHCLQMMFDEGPGEGVAHGHYNNMVSKKHAELACGFHQRPDGSIWVVQNFYP